MARTRKATRDWLTPLAIPEGKQGNYKIVLETVPAGHKVMLSTHRNALLGGQQGPHNIIYDVDTQWHKLIGPTGVWMTDYPVEQRQMEDCLKGMKGRVLIGGLGLGLAVLLLAQRKSITHVDVVEISREVIKLVGPCTKSHWDLKRFDHSQVNIIKNDLLNYLQTYQGAPYDYAFYDIWQLDSESTFFHTVVPLIQHSKGCVKNHPVCWNEDVMRGQLFHSLLARSLFFREEYRQRFPPQSEYLTSHPLWEPQGDVWHDWQVPFWKWYKANETTIRDDTLQQAASFYSQNYGKWDWEQTWAEHIKG